MRFIDGLISFIFDLVVIVLALVVALVMTNVVEFAVVDNILQEYVFNYEYQTMIVSIAVLVILAGLKITVFASNGSSKARKNILVDTTHGKIQIGQETIEDIAKNVIKEYPEVKDVQARMTKAKKGINMYMVLQVFKNTNIKDVVTKVQDDVKKQIEATTSVKVYNVDVKIRNVVSPTSMPINAKKEKAKVEAKETVVANQVDAPVTKSVEVEEQISKPATGEYMRDENDVLYKIEPNPNSKEN